MLDVDDLMRRFSYHAPPDEETKRKHERVRESLLAVAMRFNVQLPAGREKSLAITKLEEAMMWANAAIARNPGGEP